VGCWAEPVKGDVELLDAEGDTESWPPLAIEEEAAGDADPSPESECRGLDSESDSPAW
jgi:hypothetical protein